jgi:tetratricopeptide (TPR) repeat protein
VYFDSCADRVQQAQLAFDGGAWARAAQEFARALDLCPQRDQILISLGQTQFLAGDEAAAEQTLLQLPANTAARYAIGRIYYQQARYTEAAKQFESVVQREPENYKAHDNLALCYDALQRDDDALRHFFRALDLVKDKHRDYDWTYANLAEFFLKRDQFEKAFQLGAEAAERNPRSARNFFLTGQALVKLARYENSLKWLRRAVELDPSHAEAHYQLGQALRKLGRSDEAAVHLERFREIKARESSGRDPQRLR